MEDYLSADFWGQDSKKAFRYLYDKYTATLRYFASRYLEDDAVIEDVVQDAFLNLWEKRGTFQAENAVKAYLYKVVRSLSVDAIRRRRVIDRYNDYAIREEEDQEFFWKIFWNPKCFYSSNLFSTNFHRPAGKSTN